MTDTRISEDEIKRFWELCGWPIDSDGWQHRPFCNNPVNFDMCGCNGKLPDSSDLNAVFEALECFCDKREGVNGQDYYSVVLCRWGSPDRRYACFITRLGWGTYERDVSIVGEGATKQDAIIRAVLAADRRPR